MALSRPDTEKAIRDLLSTGTLTQLKIIVLALCGCVLALLAVAFVFIFGRENAPLYKGSYLETLTWICLAITVANVLAVLVLTRWQLHHSLKPLYKEWIGQKSKDVAGYFNKQLVSLYVLRTVLLEGPAIFGGVILLMTGMYSGAPLITYLTLVPTASLLFFTFISFPTKNRIVQTLANLWE